MSDPQRLIVAGTETQKQRKAKVLPNLEKKKHALPSLPQHVPWQMLFLTYHRHSKTEIFTSCLFATFSNIQMSPLPLPLCQYHRFQQRFNAAPEYICSDKAPFQL